jgi:hypothetical protein
MNKYYLPFGLLIFIFLATVGRSSNKISNSPPQEHEYIVLTNGNYDIPWHLEPNNDIHLILNNIELERLESEYSKFQPHQLDYVSSTYVPGTISAYAFSPWENDIEDIAIDDDAVAETNIQVCLGCIAFYTRGEVIELGFDSQKEAETFAYEFMEFELGKNKYNGDNMEIGSWPLFVREYLVFHLEGQSFYIVSSWMPETIDAILNYLGLKR